MTFHFLFSISHQPTLYFCFFNKIESMDEIKKKREKYEQPLSTLQVRFIYKKETNRERLLKKIIPSLVWYRVVATEIELNLFLGNDAPYKLNVSHE